MAEQNRIELIKVLHEQESNQSYPLKNYIDFQKELFQIMRQLNTFEISQLGENALVLWDDNPLHQKITQNLLMRLFCLHPDKFPPIHLQMLELGIYLVTYFYHNANLVFSQTIAEKLPDSTGLKKFRYYEIFVRGASDYVPQQVSAWETNPPAWWEPTFPIYPLEAGWELTPDGNRRQLYHETCYQLVSEDDKNPETMQREDDCPWCHYKLENLLDLDLTDPRLSFLGINGTRLKIPICAWCHAFKTQFFEIDYEGNAVWSKYNDTTPPQYLEHYDTLPNILALAKQSRGRYESLIMETGQSQLGGFPFWVNDAQYPLCPCCTKHMHFIGQVQWLDIEAAEGLSYAYLCKECKIAAVNYDQT